MVLAASPAALSSFLTLGPLTEGGYANGQLAACETVGLLGKAVYELVDAVGTADGLNILATADDSARQWVRLDVLGGAMSCWWGEEVETAALTTSKVIVPAMPGYLFLGQAIRYIVTSVAGAISSAPNIKIGNNVSHDNFVAITAGVPTTTSFNLGKNAVSNFTFAGGTGLLLDLASPVLMDVTLAATGTGAFSYKVRAFLSGMLAKAF
jgi:hypothetical protein